MVSAPESQGQDKANQAAATMQNTLARGQRVCAVTVEFVGDIKRLCLKWWRVSMPDASRRVAPEQAPQPSS
jgi:hypothetical protein